MHANRGLGAISSTSFNLAASLANNTNSRHLAHPREIPSDAEELARRACSLPILNLCLDNPRVDNLMVKYNNGTATEAEQTEWEDIIHGIFEDYFESGGVRPEPRRREDDYDDYYGEQMQM